MQCSVLHIRGGRRRSSTTEASSSIPLAFPSHIAWKLVQKHVKNLLSKMNGGRYSLSLLPLFPFTTILAEMSSIIRCIVSLFVLLFFLFDIASRVRCFLSFVRSCDGGSIVDALLPSLNRAVYGISDESHPPPPQPPPRTTTTTSITKCPRVRWGSFPSHTFGLDERTRLSLVFGHSCGKTGGLALQLRIFALVPRSRQVLGSARLRSTCFEMWR